MENSMSPADMRAVLDGSNCGYGDGWGGGMGGWWMIILFALIFGGGGFGFNNRGNCASTEDLASGFNFSALQGKTNDILAAVNNVNQNIGNAVCSSTYELGSKIDNCCCTTKFDMANYASAIQMNDTANTQKILDKLCGMEMAQKDAVIAQQGQRIAALEADARMCGVLRWPTSATYAVNCNPFFGGYNCGCNGTY